MAPTDRPATSTPQPNPTTSTETPLPEPTSAPVNSPIFGTPWADRSLYAAGLLESQQGLLDELPDASVYHMQLQIDETMQTVNGRQAVRYTNSETVPLDEVYFHLFPNLLGGEIQVGNVTVNGNPITPELEGPNDSLLRVPLPESLAPGGSAVIDMDFTTTVPTDIGRNYGIFAFYNNVLTLAHFYPMVAVYDDEGWAIETPDIQGDVTYSDTAYYLVEVTAPLGPQLVASGIAVEDETAGATQTLTFAAGPMRDFYLVASPDYMVVSDTIDGVQVNSYAPVQYPDGAQMALDVAMATVADHSEWLAPYPFTELDLVATPTSALGVEYPGIIANTERMYDITKTAANGTPWSIYLESTTAHEVGHQWFYSLVGNDQLNEPWLDEALVQYATYHYYLDRYGPEGGRKFLSIPARPMGSCRFGRHSRRLTG
ncbi:MAG: M1 family metallopeptidase [Chloroflexota bacterium]